MKKVLLIAAILIAYAGVSMGQAINTIDNAFFEQVPYVGAFGTDNWTAGWTNFNPQTTVYPSTSVTIPAGNISSNQTWTSGTSPVFNAADFTNPRLTDPFFTPVTYLGAFDGSNDWTEGWANFNPQTTAYPATTNTIPAGNITTNQTWSSGTSPVFGAADFTNPRLTDPFFTPTTYIGAFDGTTDWTSGWANFNPQTTSYPPTTVTINAGNITTNTTWTSGNVYLLNGWVYVKSGAKLTIQAGTVIRGDKVNKGALIIEQGGQIEAIGTSSNPIVFTSNQVAGSRAYGDWGGIILCGNAVINPTGGTAVIEGGVGTIYGGTNDNDNSGIMKYVRIEYPGVAFQPNNEINGLTFGGVGDGTQIDFIQVSYSGDDSYEWFGGKVNAKHLIALGGYDDDFDTDFGYRGKVQFAVSLRDPAQADQSGSNAFESDNDATGSSNTPITNPLFSNVSIFLNAPTDPDYKRAMHLRRNTKCSIYNSIFTGFPIGLFIDGTAAQTNATNNELQIENVIIAGMATNFVSAFEQNYFLAASRSNGTLTSSSALHIADPFNLTSPNFQPQVGSNVYLLNGWVYVKSGATLTIEPGTIIRGDKVNKGAIIVEPGGKIDAQGTPANPIVFTSNQVAGSRAYGDWGGIILCGNAVINPTGGTAVIEGGVGTVYGGTNDNDNSGIMKYVRIEYPGVAFQPNNEINGLTFGGVGDGTQIDFIQVSYSGDDSYEWFGGKVNAKHLIALGGYDDDFDTDFGYRGKVQFAVSLRDPAQADQSGSNAFESDNDATGSSNTPITNPLFSNVSIFLNAPTDPDYKRAMHLRRNTKCSIYNSIFTGFPIGLFIDGTAAQTNATNNELQIENVIIAGMATNFVSAFEQNYFLAASRSNGTLTSSSALHIADPFNLTSPNFQPQVGSNVYLLNGWVYVKSGATLTIEPGTIIRGDKVNKGAIIVEPGGKIDAQGTPANPIVFTSNQVAGSRAYGDWGGIILCGNAVINPTGGTAVIEGGVGTVYGGTNDNDNSGIMKYVRIEYPGVAFQPNNEINGLTFGGVGDGTQIDFIQVSYSGDDSYEWFGGFVNARHLIALGGYDDDFDTDFGYRGMVQFAVSLRDPAQADQSGSNSLESDNDATGSSNTPITQPIFSNVSSFLDPDNITDPDYKRAMHLRRNTKCSPYNSIFMGWPTGLFIDGTNTQANATANELKMHNTILSDHGTAFFASTFEQTYFETAFRKNGSYADYTSLMITNPFNLTNPNFLPMAGSPVLVRSYWTKEISGTVTYNNTANTPLPNVTVSLNGGAATAITDASGNYKFNYVWKGNYSMTASGNPFAFGGINSTDALQIKRHAIGIITLTGLRLAGADVNQSSSVNSSDALLVQRRAVGILVPTWTLPDWIYESFNLSVSTSNISQNVMGLCSGDVNGSYNPSK